MRHVLGILLAVAAPLVAQVTFNTTPSREFGQTTLVLPGPTSNAPNLIEGREFNTPSGIAFDYSVSPPAVYIADTLNDRVLAWRNSAAASAGSTADLVIGQLNFSSNIPGGPGTSQTTGLAFPVAVAVDSKGNLYVIDAGNNRILRYPTPLQQTGGLFPVDLVIGQQSVSSGIYANAGGQASSQTLAFASNHLYQSGLTFDSSGNLWVTDTLNNRVLRFPAANLTAGTVQPAADIVLGQCNFVSTQGPQYPNNTQNNLNALSSPSGLAFDTAGRLYVADGLARVVVFQPPTSSCQGAVRVLGIAQQTQQSQSYPNQYTLGLITASGSIPFTLQCAGVCGLFTIGNYLYVLDAPENRVVGYDQYQNWSAATALSPSPSEISVIGQPNYTSGQANSNQYQPSNSSLFAPLAGAVNNVTNEVWIADTGNNRVLVFPMQTFPGQAIPQFTTASRVLGQLDFPYNAANLIDGQEVFFYDSVVGTSAGGIVVDKTSTPPHLYIADPANNRVLGFMNAANVGTDSHSILKQKADLVIGQPNLMSSQPNYSPSNTQLSQAQVPNSTGLSAPIGLAVDSNGNLYVADSGNGRVVRFPQPFAQPAGSRQTANLVLGQSTFTSKIQDPSQSTMNTPYGLALFNGSTGVSNGGGLAVSDLVHNRILIFNRPVGGDFTSGQAASIVLGQQNFTSTSVPATATTASLNAPRHIATDTSDFLYVADTQNGRLMVFANASKSVNGASAALQIPGLNLPEGVAVSLVTGNIWVANTNQSQLLEYPAFQTLLANNQPKDTLTSDGPLALALDASDNLVVVNGTNRVTFFFPAMFYRNTANYTSGTPGGTCTTSTNLTPGMLVELGRYAQSAQDVFSFTAAPTQSLPWPTTGLNNVQVMVDGMAAPVWRLDPSVVYFQVPYETSSSGTADLVVQNPSTGQILAAANFGLQAAAPGIYTVNQGGTGQAAATLADGSVNSGSNAVARGSTITLWLTGSGYIPNVMDGAAPGAAISTPTLPQIFINAIQATDIQYSGVSPQYPGLWQINVTVPSNVPPGNNVPVLVLMSPYDLASNCGGTSASAGPGPDQILSPQPTIAVK